MKNKHKYDYDYVIIGGGFFGCCIALFLRSISLSILLVESESKLLNRASKNNQARVHSGFHYPRNGMTAIKSLLFHQRFATDFPKAIENNFQMLYSIAKNKSKVSAKRFMKQYENMGAPIQSASYAEKNLFQSDMIEDVFRCEEYAFNYSIIRDEFLTKISLLDIDLCLNTTATAINETEDGVEVILSTDSKVRAKYVFNVTYSKITKLLLNNNSVKKMLKHEMAEIALIEPPDELKGLAITIMDGPFFSTMPYPSTDLYSLTHVRYTPHFSFLDGDINTLHKEYLDSEGVKTKAPYMIASAKRFLPCMSRAKWIESKYEIKTVLLQNESDDGRPILYHRDSSQSRIVTIMGGKLYNIYDLFTLMNAEQSDWHLADTRYVFEK